MDQPCLHRRRSRISSSMQVHSLVNSDRHPELACACMTLLLTRPRRSFPAPPLLIEGLSVGALPSRRPLPPSSCSHWRVFVYVSLFINASGRCNPMKRHDAASRYHASNSFAFQMLDFAAMYYSTSRCTISAASPPPTPSSPQPLRCARNISSHFLVFQRASLRLFHLPHSVI
jgi:hypothetical protein